MGAKYFGASVIRREDPRLLTGVGRFVDDFVLPGMLHAAFVRSPHGHASVRAIDVEAAKRVSGVEAVLTFESLKQWMRPLPVFGAIPPGLQKAIDITSKQSAQYPLAQD